MRWEKMPILGRGGGGKGNWIKLVYVIFFIEIANEVLQVKVTAVL